MKTPRSRAGYRGLVVALAVALGVRLVNLWQISGLPVAEYQRTWSESDMATNQVWSSRILDGDLLCREAVHPYPSWMQSIAPPETWERWWGAKSVFYQAPLYAYALAGMRLIAGETFWGVGFCQAALGLANVALVFLLAHRLFAPPAPAIAALAAALYGPFLLYETLLLRDVLSVTVSLLLLVALARCEDDASPGRWLFAGVTFALAVLAREVTLFFAPFIALWMLQRRREEGQKIRAAAWFGIGVAVGLLPLVARNVAVGAPAAALSSRTLEVVVIGHAQGGLPTTPALPPPAPSILTEADGHLVEAIRLTLRSYAGDWGSLARREGDKLAAVFSRYEGIDNVDWYYFVDRSPLLRFSVSFEAALMFGLLGLAVAEGGACRHRLLWYFLLSAVPALMAFVVVGRYRLPAVAVLLVYAGGAVGWGIRQVAERKAKALALAAFGLAGVWIVSAGLLPDLQRYGRYRGAEFFLAAKRYEELGQPERAVDELRDGLRKAYAGPDQPTLPVSFPVLAENFTRIERELGRDREAVDELERLARRYPGDASVQELLGAVYRDGLGRRDLATEHLEKARRLRGP